MEGHTILHNDYFADDATQADNFRSQYRMSKGLFMNTLHCVPEFDPYFKLKHDDVGIVGFSSIQKCTTAMSMFAYGAPADTQDDYLRMSESTTIECMYKFCPAVGLFARLSASGPCTLRKLTTTSDRNRSFDSTRRAALKFQELSPAAQHALDGVGAREHERRACGEVVAGHEHMGHGAPAERQPVASAAPILPDAPDHEGERLLNRVPWAPVSTLEEQHGREHGREHAAGAGTSGQVEEVKDARVGVAGWSAEACASLASTAAASSASPTPGPQPSMVSTSAAAAVGSSATAARYAPGGPLF
ncbi:hypothetical protein QYE76_007366 [Lolium multiflorum]|uniref:Uncharacterized protein n=1 Tax=Lolium multiflorum TaxID=4521 RepID=A0AAD8RWP9_LOLMU|nr:hypothetical protein QYE76_007366 [Lolium multiflorum]